MNSGEQPLFQSVDDFEAPRTDETTSAIVPDGSRAATNSRWAPSCALLASIRRYQRNEGRTGVWPWFVRKLAVLSHRFWSAVTGADIPIKTRIGGCLLLPHPNGIVIHPPLRSARTA